MSGQRANPFALHRVLFVGHSRRAYLILYWKLVKKFQNKTSSKGSSSSFSVWRIRTSWQIFLQAAATDAKAKTSWASCWREYVWPEMLNLWWKPAFWVTSISSFSTWKDSFTNFFYWTTFSSSPLNKVMNESWVPVAPFIPRKRRLLRKCSS